MELKNTLYSFLSDVTAHIPFTYFWTFRKSFDGKIKSVLDLGCNDGRILEFVFAGNIPKLEFTGVDLYEDYLEGARKKKIYKNLYKLDVRRKNWGKIEKRKYDLVLCSQLIEHLTKQEGNRLIKKMEFLSKKRVMIATPNGFQKFNPLENHIWDEYESNLDQGHKSGWITEEFRKRGYKVYGQGLNIVYGANSIIRKLPKFTYPVFFIISFMLSPIIYFYPKIAYNLIAIKDL